MRIKMSQLVKCIILFLFIIMSSLLKPFGEGLFFWSRDALIKRTCVYVTLFCFVFYLFKLKKKNGFLNVCAFFLLSAVIINVFRSSESTIAALRLSYNYYYVLLAFPIYSMLVDNKWKLIDLLKSITNIAFLAYILKIIISLIELFYGKVLFESIALESVGKLSYRAGLLRINPPVFGIVIIPIAFFLFYNETLKKRKLYYIIVICTAFLYSMFIHGARSLTVYQLIEIIFLIMLKRRSGKKQVIVFCMLGISLIIAINLPFVESLINSFSTTGAYGSSTVARLYALAHFTTMWLKSPILGVGFLPFDDFTLMGEYTTLGTLWDIGVMQSVVQIGIGAILFYVYFICYGIRTGIRLHRKNSNGDVLVLGIVVAVFLTAINIDWFMDIYALSVPVGLAIIAYMSHFNTNNNEWNLRRCVNE